MTLLMALAVEDTEADEREESHDDDEVRLNDLLDSEKRSAIAWKCDEGMAVKERTGIGWLV